MAVLSLLGLYAASRVKAGNDLREKEKQALIPVQYVETANGDIVQRDKDDPMHNNLATRYTKVGNQMITAADTSQDIVIDPKTKVEMTTDQYRSNVLSNINKRANPDGLDYGGVNPNQVIMPPVIGQRKRFSGEFTPRTTAKKSANIVEQVGGMIKDKVVFSNSIAEYLEQSNGVLPTIKRDFDTDTNKGNNRAKLTLSEKTTAPAKKTTYFSTTSIEREVKDKDNNTTTYDFQLSSNNKNPTGQVQDIHNQLSHHVAYFQKLGKKDINDPKLIAFTNSVIGLLATDMEISTDLEGENAQFRTFKTVDTYLKSKPNFRNIPGLALKLQFAIDNITQTQLDQRVNELNLNKNSDTVTKGVVVKTNNGVTATMTAEVHKKFLEPRIVDGKKAPSVADTLVNSYGDPNKTVEENNAIVEVLSDYEYTRLENGDLNAIKVENGKKILKPYDQQYKIRYLENLMVSPASGKNNNQFKVFNAMVQPVSLSGDTVVSSTRDEGIIRTKYVKQIGSLSNGYQEGHRLLSLVAKGGNNAFVNQSKLLKNQIFSVIREKLPYQMDKKNAQEFLADSINKVQYSSTTIQLMKRYKGTYFDPRTGKPLDISTAVGELYLGTDGLLYWFDKARDMAGRLLDSDDASSVYAGVGGQKVVETEQLLLRQIGEGNFKRSEIGRNDELYEQRQNDMKDIASKLKSENNAERALAQRRYYRMMIAYQMAAAIQGGTGGRTISDQDVDNILKALGSAEALATPGAEIAGIDAALTLMQEIYQFNKHLSGTPEERYIAMKHQDFMIKGDPDGVTYTPITYDADYVENAIYSAMGTGRTGGKPKVENVKVSDVELLESINATAAFSGESYGSLKDAQEAGIDLDKQRNLIRTREGI